MNRRSLKVFIACFLGGCIGSVVALEVSRYFWWVGLLAGAGVGYLSYDFKEVARAIPLAWHSVMHWQPDRKFWKDFGYFFLGMCSIFSTSFFGMAGLLSLYDSSGEGRVPSLAMIFSFLIFTGVAALAIALEPTSEKLNTGMKVLLYKGNPFIVYFYYLPKYIIIGMWFMICSIPSFFTAIGRGFAKLGLFVWIVFRFIHSDMRLLCAVDAAIGVCAGFFLGSAIFGGLVGGLWGVLNFEILSKRVLKLVPFKVRIS